jgi:hypothetical protein
MANFESLHQGRDNRLDMLPKVYPTIGGIRTKAGFLSKVKELSRMIGYVFEAKAGAGQLLVITFGMSRQLDSHGSTSCSEFRMIILDPMPRVLDTVHR